MRTQISKWFPAFLMMLVIFLFSAQPGSSLPAFDWADQIVKKGGHMIGYGLLGISYWRAFDFKDDKRWVAWLLAVLYALTDEYHQSFVSDRHPSVLDVILFDNFGVLLSLWIVYRFRKEKQSDREPSHSVTENTSH